MISSMLQLYKFLDQYGPYMLKIIFINMAWGLKDPNFRRSVKARAQSKSSFS